MMDRILVCGLGSMGRRRIKILKLLYPGIEIFGVDINKKRQEWIAKEYKIKTGPDYIEAIKKFTPQASFVCSSPLTHPDIVLYLLKKGIHTFSEINLSSAGYDAILKTAEKNNLVAFLSSTFLYKKEIEWIIGHFKDRRLIYRYHVGQYLPNWHPWENFTDFFVSRSETNAIREIMAIELPWILKAFGNIVDYNAMKGKISQLKLDYPDTFHINIEHRKGTLGSLTLDCVSCRAVRKLELYSDKEYISWNGSPDTLSVYSCESGDMIPIDLQEKIVKDECYDDFIIENPYIEEVKEFFGIMEGKTSKARYSYTDDMKVLEVIDRIEADI